MLNAELLPDLLDAPRERALIHRIEAGQVAAHALRHPWPTDASRQELRRIRRDGAAAWQEFLAANLRLAAMLAGQACRRTGMDFDDLFQEGAVALVHALQRFDPARGRFSTYAFPVIRRHLTRVTSSLDGQLGVPPSRAVTLRRAQALAEALAQELARTPELADIAEALGRAPDWTARLLGHRPPLPLESVGELPATAVVGSDSREDTLVVERLWAEIARLPGDQRLVIRLRFGLVDGHCHSYREIASRHDLSPTSIRRIEQRGLAALRSGRTGAPVDELRAG